jgi:hypothetical protein
MDDDRIEPDTVGNGVEVLHKQLLTTDAAEERYRQSQ